MQYELGKILKPQGIKGELKVLPFTKTDEFKVGREVVLCGKLTKIIACSIRDGYAYVMLESCKDRNIAEELRDEIIYLPENEAINLNDGEFLFADLVDCVVYDEFGRNVGKVVEVENYGATDILTIHRDFCDISCPFLRDVFVSVDTKVKKIVVNSAKFNEVTNYDED